MIYLVSLYYPPVSNPPANRMSHMVRVLVGKYGPENVRVVTGRPNYPDGKVRVEDRRRFFRSEVGESGEIVQHLYEFAVPFKGRTLKTAGQISFAISVLFYFMFRSLRENDLIYVTSGPIFPVYVIHALSKIRRRMRYILDVRDLWPQVIVGFGHMRETSLAYRLLKKWADQAYRDAIASVGVVEGICDYIESVAPEHPVELIYNPVDTNLFRPLAQVDVDAFKAKHFELFGDSSKTVFLYCGVHSNAIDLWTAIRALRRLREKLSNFLFIFIGYGEQKDGIQRYAEEHGLLGNVVFLPFQPRSELLKYICASDYCYSSTSREPIFRMVIPTKMCEYMACNRFVIAVHDCPFAERVAETGNAVVVPPGDVDAVVAALADLIARKAPPVVTSRDYILKHHSADCFKDQIQSLFRDIDQRAS